MDLIPGFQTLAPLAVEAYQGIKVTDLTQAQAIGTAQAIGAMKGYVASARPVVNPDTQAVIWRIDLARPDGTEDSIHTGDWLVVTSGGDLLLFSGEDSDNTSPRLSSKFQLPES